MKRRANPRCCPTCNRPLIALADADRFAEACHACHAPAEPGEPSGHACAVCGVADPRMLGVRRMLDGWAVLCANHGAVLGARSIPLEALAAECSPRRRSA